MVKCLSSSMLSWAKLKTRIFSSQICFRVTNSSLSAMMTLGCDARFFEEYDLYHCDVLCGSVAFKDFVPIFRTQKVKQAIFELNATSNRMVIVLMCDNGVRKQYTVPTATDNMIEATLDRDSCLIQLTAKASKLSKILSTFHSNVPSVALRAFPTSNTQLPCNAVEFRSYAEFASSGKADKSLHTVLSIESANNFLDYANSTGEIVEIVFSIKDFRAMLSLCESLDCDLKMLFRGPGSPVLAEAYLGPLSNHRELIAAELLLATNPPCDEQISPEPMPRAGLGNNVRNHQNELEQQEDYGIIGGTPPDELQTNPVAIPGQIIPSFE